MPARIGPVEFSMLGGMEAPIMVLPRGRHSAKPDVFYTEVEKMFPGAPKLEMFARGQREGWDVWGDQSGGAWRFCTASDARCATTSAPLR